MKTLLKSGLAGIITVLVLSTAVPSVFAENSDPPKRGHISGRTVVAGVLSLLIWPGIGQAVNSDAGKKVVTHAVIGILPPFRFWSGYDALVDRKGGYWNGKI